METTKLSTIFPLPPNLPEHQYRVSDAGYRWLWKLRGASAEWRRAITRRRTWDHLFDSRSLVVGIDIYTGHFKPKDLDLRRAFHRRIEPLTWFLGYFKLEQWEFDALIGLGLEMGVFALAASEVVWLLRHTRPGSRPAAQFRIAWTRYCWTGTMFDPAWLARREEEVEYFLNGPDEEVKAERPPARPIDRTKPKQRNKRIIPDDPSAPPFTIRRPRGSYRRPFNSGGERP